MREVSEGESVCTVLIVIEGGREGVRTHTRKVCSTHQVSCCVVPVVILEDHSQTTFL